MEERPVVPAGEPDDEERVPFFGTWRAIYTAVVFCALAFMGLIAAFSYWEY